MERTAAVPQKPAQTPESEALYMCSQAFVQIRRLSVIVGQIREPRGLFSRFSSTNRSAVETREKATKLIHVLSDAAHNLPEVMRVGSKQGGLGPGYLATQTDLLARALSDARALKWRGYGR
ncbi:hypothetical protein [Ralstonia pseudosolanacearum]|uniref:hypothetical protein n=1 Tax=Ralstonia pseudosolanacearum TaxID=1310165 RepID=UPI003CF636B2